MLKPDVECDKIESDSGIPDDHIVICCDCDWKGLISDCEVEMDSEGWEYPEYEVLVCPRCGETNIEI